MKSLDITALIRSAVGHGGPLSLSQQLRSVFEIAAAAGELPEGLQLPSVRTLAKQLGLAPNTVVRAYKQLEAEGLVRASPRRGYYIAGSDRGLARPARAQVQGLVDEALRAAERAGLDTVQFLQLVSRVVKARREQRERIAVVGERDAALESRVEVIARALADLPVEVRSLSFEDLDAPDGPVRAAGFDSYLVPTLDIERATRLLGPHAHRILPMYLTLAGNVRSFIASKPARTRFGVVASREEYQARLATAIRRVHSPGARINTAPVDRKGAVERVVRESDVLLVASPALPRMPRTVKVTQPMIEMVFLPDDETIRRIRAIVAADTSGRRG